MVISREIYKRCELCPRMCHADRTAGTGYCGMGAEAVLAKAMLHPWEEPGITDGERPSGAVFFSGCTLGCVYCQNRKISRSQKPPCAESGTEAVPEDREIVGMVRDPQRLSDIFLRLQKEGACNIDLVTPTHFLPDIREALDLAGDRLTLPVVYNTGGYERAKIIREISPYITYWLPDMKYFDDDLAVRFSNAPRYFETACEALAEMIRAAARRPGERRKAAERVILRHLVFPGHSDDSIKLLHALADRFGTESFTLSLLSQYTPFEKVHGAPELSRRLTTYEYEKVLNEALKLGFHGYRQFRTSAKEEYTPEFDLSGL